jgi:translation initiation factor IF-1
MTLMVVIWFYRTYTGSVHRLATGLVPLGVPLVIGAIAFGWYNWARFGSISETGFNYALAGPNLRAHFNELFLPAYSFQNLYNYFLNPFAVKQAFPFFYPLRGVVEEIFPWQDLPEFYAAQAITGVLYAAPFTVFCHTNHKITATIQQKSRKALNADPNMAISLDNHQLDRILLFSFLCLPCFSGSHVYEDFANSRLQYYRFGRVSGSLRIHQSKMYTTVGFIW